MGHHRHFWLLCTRNLLLCVLFGIGIILCLLLCIGAWLVYEDLPAFVLDAAVLLSVALGAFCTGYAGGRVQKEHGLLYGSICGGILAGIFLLVPVGSRSISASDLLLPELLLQFFAAAIGGIFGVNRHKRRIKY